MKNLSQRFLLIAICIVLSGCGETISGVQKDTVRMGKGVSTILFKQ